MGHRLNVCMLPFPLRRGNVIACKYTYFTLNGNCRRPFFYASAVKDGANGRECGLPQIPRRSRPTAKVAAIAPARPCHGGVARSLPAKKRLRRRPNILSVKSLPFAFKFVTLPPTRQARGKTISNASLMSRNKNAMARYLALDRCFSRGWRRRFYIEDLVEECSRTLLDSTGSATGISRRQVLDDIKFMESSEGWSIKLDRCKDGRRGAAAVRAVPRGQPRQGPQRPWVGDRMKQAAHRCAQPVSRYAPTRGRSLRRPSPPSWRV